MKTHIKYFILLCISLLSPCLFAINAQDLAELKDLENIEQPIVEWTHDQLEVKAAVDRLLAAAGNQDSKILSELTTENANMGIARMKAGKWITETLMVSEYIESLENREKQPYLEPVSKYAIHISDGHLAIVKADAILYRFGVPQTYELDNFTLIKTDDSWKFVNVSFSVTPVPKSRQEFDIQSFAKGYTQAWCSGKPEFVAQFYAENGSLTVNDNEPAIGRKAIADVARGFMETFPDMILTCDKVQNNGDGIEFRWTFTGTYTGVTGMDHPVKFSGTERWQMDENNLIKTSKGQFDEDEYARQMNYGVAE